MGDQTGKIVVFDSGLGGISVLRELVKLMPQEQFLYFGDSAMAPYGARSTQEVCALTVKHIDELVDEHTKAVVIACNTATSAAIETLRQKYPAQIIVGIEPALKMAADRFPGGRILVLATEVTLREEKFAVLTRRFEQTHQIVKVACPGLVELIEAGILQGPVLERRLQEILAPHLHRPVDAVVLGCTHYPFVRSAIQQIVGPDVCILDGGEGTARETKRRLMQQDLLRREGCGSVEFRNSLDQKQIYALSAFLLRHDGQF